MRQTISGLLAAIAFAVAGAAPAMACGYGGCALPYGYAGCAAGCGWAYYDYDRLADPETQYHAVAAPPQYYYVNQGPTYTGPGAFAPYPTYREAAVSAYRWRHHYHFQRQGHYQGRPVLRRAY
jgi:hypothetical protein